MKAWFAHYDKRGHELYLTLDSEAYSKLCILAQRKDPAERPTVTVEFHQDSVALIPAANGSGRKISERQLSHGERRYSINIKTERARRFPLTGTVEAEIRFELNAVHIQIPTHTRTPRYHRKRATAKPSPPRRSATLLMDLEGKTLEFSLPIGDAVDLALRLSRYRKGSDES